MLNLAVSSKLDSLNGKNPFFVISDKAKKEIPTYRDSFGQVASFSRDHIIKHYDGMLEPYIQEIAVSCSTLNKIIEDQNLKKLI